MRYVAEINGRAYNVDVDEAADACRVQIDGQCVIADLQQVTEPCLFSLLKDGKSYEIFAEPTDKGFVIVIAGQRFVVNVADERSLRLAQVQKRQVERRGDMIIKSPMPGLVLDVLVRDGETVATGQPLVILVAMKMENEIRAFEAGVVRSVHVQKGDKVDQGQTLVTIH